MPTDPANITFAAFTSDTVLFASKAAANQFFNDIKVPIALEASSGVVKRLPNLPALDDTTYINIPVVAADGSVGVTQVVDKASFDALKAAFTTLLITLKGKGVMTED